MADHWEIVRSEIEDFRRYFAADFPNLEIIHAFDNMMLESDWGWGVKSGIWQKSGVYLVYDDAGKLLYVGKATATFNKRIKKQGGIENASSIAIIPFPEGYICFAHALEAFLISRLQPPENKCGINDYIPRREKRGCS